MLDEQTVMEQKAWEHYAKIDAENHRLKKALHNLEKELKGEKKKFNGLLRKYNRLNSNRKDRYRNNGKGGK